MNVREGYIGFLNQVIDKYVNEKDNLILYCQDLNRKKNDESMMRTIKIVVKTVAFTRLKALGNHSLSEINAWTNRDEVLTQRIYHDLQKNDKPGLYEGPDDQEVYAAHVVAAATISLVKKPQLELVTNLAIESLCEQYNSNPVWRGLGAFRSDVEKRDEWKGRNKLSETIVK